MVDVLKVLTDETSTAHLLVDDKENAITTAGKDVVLQRCRSVVSVDAMARWLSMEIDDPFGELSGVGDGGGEKDLTDTVRQEDNRLLPHDTSFLLSHIVDFIKDNPTQLSGHLRTAISNSIRNLISNINIWKYQYQESKYR